MDLATEFLSLSDHKAAHYPKKSWGKRVYSAVEDFDPENTIAIFLGCEEYRGADQHAHGEADAIKEAFFRLYPIDNSKGRILDLGNLKPGATLSDSYAATQTVLFKAIQLGIPIIVLGGSSDNILPILSVYEKLEAFYSVLAIDYSIDFNGHESAHWKNYLHQFFHEHPSFLYQYLHAGIQGYLQNPDVLKFFHNVHYDATRLGVLRNQLSKIEPMLRLSNACLIDAASVKVADMPGTLVGNPNGFYIEDLCQIAKYAGFNGSVNVLGIFDVSFALCSEREKQITASGWAQVLWCFMEALPFRIAENPKPAADGFKRYTVHVSEWDQDLVFYKSTKTARWWLQAPRKNQENVPVTPFQMLPCLEEDYNLASQNTIPEAWWVSLFRSN